MELGFEAYLGIGWRVFAARWSRILSIIPTELWPAKDALPIFLCRNGLFPCLKGVRLNHEANPLAIFVDDQQFRLVMLSHFFHRGSHSLPLPNG